MVDKMYEMFSIDGFKYRKKMNNKIMWEEMGSDENRPYWVIEARNREYESKINKIEKKEEKIPIDHLRDMGFEYA